jgi:hypothetical protein
MPDSIALPLTDCFIQGFRHTREQGAGQKVRENNAGGAAAWLFVTELNVACRVFAAARG